MTYEFTIPKHKEVLVRSKKLLKEPNKKKVFILEDDHGRIDIFKEVLEQDYDLTICENSDDGIKAVQTKKFDILMLDHDLGGNQMVDSGQYDTGFRVACEIPNTVNKKTPVIVHSYNPTGSYKMLQVIPHDNKYRRPFEPDIYDESYWGFIKKLLN